MSKRNLHSQSGAADQAPTRSWQEAMSAITSEAAEQFTVDPAIEDGVVIEDGQPDENAETDAKADTAQAEGDEAGDNADESVDDANEPETAADDEDEIKGWDGSPDKIPAKLKPVVDKAVEAVVSKRLDEMNKGVAKRLREISAYEKQLQAKMNDLQQLQIETAAGKRHPGAVADGPPTPPAEDSSQKEWDSYYDAKTQWTVNNTIKTMVANGQLITPDQIAPVQQQAANQKRLQLIAQQPGASDDVMFEMVEIVKAKPSMASMLDTDEGIIDLFEIAKERVEFRGAASQSHSEKESEAKKLEEAARHAAGAAERALPRPGSTRNAAMKTDGLPPGKVFRNTAEKIEYITRQAQREFGG